VDSDGDGYYELVKTTSAKLSLTPLQKLLKLVFGRTKLVDNKASISDYLFSLPTKQSSVIAMREKIFHFLMGTST
jgi:hypothetical protein